MRLPKLRISMRGAMLWIGVISILLGVVSWARKNVPISYQEFPTRSGQTNYRAYYADGTFREKNGKSGRWERDPKSGHWVVKP
ncbi:hypothetical protein [Paludisphaera rhizosphaerae]|uniref:hypothetical protein n=1 Tax=Paludisphaera rhizosphaerae TaxID=2711216 RepID=UPI0013EA5786|nr:hypothetical protein [Paludisphaera rhizosphaerae]